MYERLNVDRFDVNDLHVSEDRQDVTVHGIPDQYYDVDVITALNLDESGPENYGDKFYDIKISEAPSTKIRGALPSRTSPHKIRFVENTSDKLSVAQKNRAVKSAGLKFSAEKAGGPTVMGNALANAGKLRSPKPRQSRYALSNLDYEVRSSTNAWQRDHTTAEVKSMYPNLWDITADESETRNPTQVRDTIKTYRKIYDLLKAEGFKGKVLDASSGLGDGTRAGREEYGFQVEDIEPYPDKNYAPMYTDYDSLNEKYDAIISNAVLNVLPQDQRDALVVKMGELLNPGGKMYINVRGDDVRGNKSNQPVGGKWEYYVASTGSYQKGFTKPELKAYLEDALGDGYTVRIANGFGKTAAIVTKEGDVGRKQTKPVIPAKNAPVSESRYALGPGEEAVVYIKDGHRSDGSTVDFVDAILNGEKLIETRDHNRLKQGWVGLSKGGKDGKVVGRMLIGKPIEVSNDPSLPKYDKSLYEAAMIEGTDFDIQPGKTKWFYPILGIEDFRDNPKPILRNGNYGVYQRDAIANQNGAEYNSSNLSSRIGVTESANKGNSGRTAVVGKSRGGHKPKYLAMTDEEYLQDLENRLRKLQEETGMPSHLLRDSN